MDWSSMVNPVFFPYLSLAAFSCYLHLAHVGPHRHHPGSEGFLRRGVLPSVREVPSGRSNQDESLGV